MATPLVPASDQTDVPHCGWKAHGHRTAMTPGPQRQQRPTGKVIRVRFQLEPGQSVAAARTALAAGSGLRSASDHRRLAELHAAAGALRPALAVLASAPRPDAPDACFDMAVRTAIFARRLGDLAAAGQALDGAAAHATDPQAVFRLFWQWRDLAMAWFARGALDRCVHCLAKAERVDPPGILWARPDLFRRFVADDAPALARAVRAGTGWMASLAAWGTAHADLFCRLTAPSLLAAGNLDSLHQTGSIRLVIHTRPEDMAAFHRHDLFAALDRVCPVVFRPIPAPLLDLTTDPAIPETVRYRNRLQVVSACQEATVRAAQAVGAGFLPLFPDTLFSAGMLGQAVAMLTATGPIRRDIVMTSGLMVTRPAAAALTATAASRPVALSAATLTDLYRRHRHAEADAYRVRDDGIACNHRPNQILFDTDTPSRPPDGCIAHHLYWHPVLIAADRVARYSGMAIFTIDHRLLDTLDLPADWAPVGFLDDPDTAVMVGANPPGQRGRGGPPSVWSVERLAAGLAPGDLSWELSPANLRLLARPIRIGRIPAGLEQRAAAYRRALFAALDRHVGA